MAVWKGSFIISLCLFQKMVELEQGRCTCGTHAATHEALNHRLHQVKPTTASFFCIKELIIPWLVNQWGEVNAWLKEILHRGHGKRDMLDREKAGPQGKGETSCELET